MPILSEHIVWINLFIIVLILQLFVDNRVSAACNSLTEFTCQNGNCIPLEKINNTVNDCGDNTEEGVYFVCPKQGQFKCTLAGICVPAFYVGDGALDCDTKNGIDKSDEAKIVGSACAGDGGCCGCDVFIPESQCNTTLLCDCKSGRYSNQIGTECIIRKMWDPCSTNPDCSDAIVNTVCRSSICDCRMGNYVSADNTTCIKRVLYDDCSIHGDCSAAMPNSNCTNSQCLCDNGYKPNSDNTTCNRRKIGDVCILQTDCFPAVTHSLCGTDGKCQCEYNYKVNNDKTKCLTLQLYDPCINDTQCSFGVTYSNCTNEQCMCDSGYNPHATKVYCTPRRIGDATCVLDTDCSDSVANSSCVSGTCWCLLGFRATAPKDQCLPYEIGDTCPVKQDCYTSFDPNICINWNVCENTTDCTTSVSHSYCGANSTCECDPGYYVLPDNTTCQARHIGDHCLTDSYCCAVIGGAVCVNETCQCDSGYVYENSTAQCRTRLLNESCTLHSDCSLVPNSQCADLTCSCVLGYKASINLTSCDSLQIGDSCASTKECAASVSNSHCYIAPYAVTGTCTCNQGLLPNPADTHCFDFQLNISNCTESAVCLTKTLHSLCVAGVCVCETNYVADENATSCVVPSIGQLTCDTSSYCTTRISHSHCENSLCTCDTGYRPDPVGTSCVLFTLGDSGCRNDLDCSSSVDNSYCNNNSQCICASGFYDSVDGSQCFNEPDIGGSSTCSSIMCIPWAIALICILIAAIILTVLMIVLGPVTGKITFCAKRSKRKVVPTDTYKSSLKPPPEALWAITSPGIKVMYEDTDLAEPHEIEFDNDSGMYEDTTDLMFCSEGLLDYKPPPYSEMDPSSTTSKQPHSGHSSISTATQPSATLVINSNLASETTI